ncbi:MAG: hypothetical protein RLZZ437_935 [Pseudomonadota bacterium]|jgi:hypothetical protein
MVIDMDNVGPGGAAIAPFAELRGYWEALRPSGGLPRRADLDPRGLKYCLHQTVIAEQIAPGLARVRLAGATFTDLMGMELRGMPLSALFDPMARAELETALTKVFTGKTAVTLRMEAERGLGRPALMGQMLLLPMRGETDAPDLLLGCLVLRGTAGRTPRRFHILRTTCEALDQTAPLVPPEVARRIPVFAEETVPFRHPETRPSAVPYLRVVK